MVCGSVKEGLETVSETDEASLLSAQLEQQTAVSFSEWSRPLRAELTDSSCLEVKHKA